MEGEVGERAGEGAASPSWSGCLAAPAAGQAELPVESGLSPPAHRPGSFLWASASLSRA